MQGWTTANIEKPTVLDLPNMAFAVSGFPHYCSSDKKYCSPDSLQENDSCMFGVIGLAYH